MPNLLTGKMPTTVAVAGKAVPVKWQYQHLVAVEIALQDAELSREDQMLTALVLFYGEDSIPRDVKAAFEALLEFYKGDEKPLNDAQALAVRKHKNAPPVRSFEQDDAYIYAAFWQQYGINLTQVPDLHWYEFRALLHGLDDCPLTRIMSWRGTNLAEIKDPAERRRMEKQKRYWELPDPQAAARRKVTDKLNKVLMHGGDISEVVKGR